MKFSFMISLVGWVILFVAVAIMYFVVEKLGVFTSIEHTVGLVTSTKGKSGTNAASWFSASRVLGYTMLVGAVNVVLITALATDRRGALQPGHHAGRRYRGHPQGGRVTVRLPVCGNLSHRAA